MTPDEIFLEFVKIEDPEQQRLLVNRMYKNMRQRLKHPYGRGTGEVYTPVRDHPTNDPADRNLD